MELNENDPDKRKCINNNTYRSVDYNSLAEIFIFLFVSIATWDQEVKSKF